MLIVKVYSNQEQIGEIHIQNCGLPISEPITSDARIYRIRKPKEFDKEKFEILHCRKYGWQALLRMTLDVMGQEMPKEG